MATLVKQSHLPEFESMERRFHRIFEGTPLTAFVPVFLPAADVYETAEEYVVELEVPGYKEGELSVEVSNHTLVVAGMREEEKEGTEKAYRLQERLERTFRREFRLPSETDREHVTAHFEEGILEVHAPKLATTKSHMVEISKA
ncbi:MAG TPA: Hsp20/alpha crystallin family protein [Gaiellaceae bacterium]|jgi:HSP20 family protein|nr:Hsp20/alpha crystallin family protein [Gaiellaceae bacterium]